jgi:2-methylcitrate dehydratase PrpD
LESIVEFAEALVARGHDDLDPVAAHEARRCLLNVLGTTIGASQVDATDRLVGACVGGFCEVVPPGRTEALDRYSAALVIGFSGHLDDYDDTHLETVIHPGAATLGALYPVALTARLAGPLTFRAFALGVESQLRVGLAMSPSHYDLGWHITGTCGVIGAVVAASTAMGFDAVTLGSALGIAAQMTLGHREAFGTPVKAFHAGKAASNGLLAATLAGSGVVPEVDPFRAGGFFEVLADTCDEGFLDPDDVARRWVLRDNTYKPFPCGIVAHPAIEAAIGLHARLSAAELESIEDVVVRCNPLVLELMGRPTATTGLEARFCAVHGVAVGLLDGAAGLAQFSDERAVEPLVAGLRARTRLLPDESCGREAAIVTVTLRDGAVAEQDVRVAAGSASRPLSDAQLLEKFRVLVEPVLPGRSEAIAAATMAIGVETSMSDIDALIAAEVPNGSSVR